jgi:F-type H+-transporting ATPase subunit epsilon
MKEDQPEERFQAKVFSPYQVFFEGSAVSLSAVNRTGPFDVLYGHSNFFSLLTPGIVRVNNGFDQLEIEITNGILKISGNTAILFANV